MFLNTQSVSRPERDSIYSFLRHLGPLQWGALQHQYLVKTHVVPIWQKTRFLKKEYSHASVDHQEQFLLGFSIFHSPWLTQGLWKISKKKSFSKNWLWKREKICVFFSGNGKNGKNSKKKMKMKLVLCIVWYIFFADFIVDVLIFKQNIFLNFAQF